QGEQEQRLNEEHNLVWGAHPSGGPLGIHQDERKQIEGERNGPDQRKRREVDGDIGRYAEHQAGGNGGQKNPADTTARSHLVGAGHAGVERGSGGSNLLLTWLEWLLFRESRARGRLRGARLDSSFRGRRSVRRVDVRIGRG